MVASFGEAEVVEQFLGTAICRALAFAADKRRQSHIFNAVEFGQETVELEHEPDVPVTESGEFGFAQSHHVDSLVNHLSRVGTVESADNLEQSGLAGTAGTHNCHHFGSADCCAHSFQHFNISEMLCYVGYFNHFQLYVSLY